MVMTYEEYKNKIEINDANKYAHAAMMDSWLNRTQATIGVRENDIAMRDQIELARRLAKRSQVTPGKALTMHSMLAANTGKTITTKEQAKPEDQVKPTTPKKNI